MFLVGTSSRQAKVLDGLSFREFRVFWGYVINQFLVVVVLNGLNTGDSKRARNTRSQEPTNLDEQWLMSQGFG